MQVHQAGPLVGYAITAAIVLVVLALRLRSVRRARRLRLETLWILPAIYAVVATGFVASHPPRGLAWLWAGAALALGAAIGWQRGRLMRIAVDPETHRLSQQSSIAGFALLIGLLVVRQGARIELGQGHAAFVATDVAMAFGLGFVAAMRAEMAIRARRLLGEARARATL